MLGRREFLGAVTCLALTVAIAQGASGKHLQRYSRQLVPPAGSNAGYAGSKAGYGGFEPDTAMFIHAGTPLQSLRIYDQPGQEVPYRPRYTVAKGSVVTGAQLRLVKPLLQQQALGQAVFATGATSPAANEPIAHDGIRIRVVPGKTSGGFLSTAKVEASDDRKSWVVIARTSVTMPRADARPRVAQGAATYPTSSFRFLRVTVPGALQVMDAEIDLVQGQRFFTPPLVARSPRQVKVIQTARDTSVLADFGGAGVPVETVEIDTATGTFDRPYELRAADTQARLKQPGSVFSSGSLVRTGVRNDTTITNLAAGSRYVRVTIHNGDDRPLKAITMRLLSRSRAVLFQLHAGRTYIATYGDALPAPIYDLARLPLDPGRALDAASFKLGHEIAQIQPPKNRTWLERNPWTVNAIAALVALIVLSGVIWVLVRTRASSGPQGPANDSEEEQVGPGPD